jgi:putative transposase
MRYSSDLIDEQWMIIEHLFPKPSRKGRPRQHTYQELVNACMYLVRAGCDWRLLPKDLPPWQTVAGYYYKWMRSGLWEKIHTGLRETVRRSVGRKAKPSAGIIDSQSVKSTEYSGERGYDAGKKINGRKRHIVVDTMGLLLLVLVLPASIQDRDGAKGLFAALFPKFRRIKLIWADGGYAGQLIQWVREQWHRKLEIVKRSDDTSGFKILPRRWVVERTFGWLGRYRRLSKDYERKAESGQTVVYIAMIRLMLRRLAK